MNWSKHDGPPPNRRKQGLLTPTLLVLGAVAAVAVVVWWVLRGVVSAGGNCSAAGSPVVRVGETVAVQFVIGETGTSESKTRLRTIDGVALNGRRYGAPETAFNVAALKKLPLGLQTGTAKLVGGPESGEVDLAAGSHVVHLLPVICR